MSARRTIRFAVFNALVARGGRVLPFEVEDVANEITDEILDSKYRWALKELGEEKTDGS